MARRSVRGAVTLAVITALAVVGVLPASASVAAKTPPKTEGFDGKTIKLGVITPLTGTVSLLGIPLAAGNQLWWDYVNDELGGIGGKYKVELLEEDSAYQAPQAIQAYDKIKDDVVAFQQIMGTQVTQALLPKMKIDQVGGSPATLDATWVKNPNLFPIAAPYEIEVMNSFDYYVKNGGKGKKICALAQDDSYGQAGLDGLAAAKKALKFKTGPSPRFRTGTDLTAQIQELADAKCDAVLLAATAADATAILTKSNSLNFSPRLIALAPFWLPLFAQNAALQDFIVQNLWVANEPAAAWGDSSIDGMDEFIARQQKYAPDQKPDPYVIYGYGQGQALYQILEKAVKNGDLSHEGILKASTQIGKVKIAGTDDYFYGKKASERKPPLITGTYGVDPAAPIGLTLVAPVSSSTAAKKFKFPAG